MKIWMIEEPTSTPTSHVAWTFRWFQSGPRVGEEILVGEHLRVIISVTDLGKYWIKHSWLIKWEGDRDEFDPEDEEELVA